MQKFYIIYENLLKHDHVLFTDGDIVFENCNFIEYLINNIKDNDLLIQEEYDGPDLCSGFMLIKSTEKTKKLFNPENVSYRKTNWGDQIHINSIKHNLKYKKLDLDLFPNGRYYMDKDGKMNPYIIHFNHLLKNDKMRKMKEYGKWYI